jgi:hypothetical protein
MGIKGKFTIASFSSCIFSAKDDVNPDGRKRKYIFNLRVILKHTKIDTLVDSGLQVNLISEQFVQKLGL